MDGDDSLLGVIEVKITEFDFPDIGQLVGYTTMGDQMITKKNETTRIYVDS